MAEFLRAVLAFLRVLFPRPVRASLYASGIAAVAALVVAEQLPVWSAPIAAPLLLALLHLNPKDVETNQFPEGAASTNLANVKWSIRWNKRSGDEQ